MNLDEYVGPHWEPWRFGMSDDDFGPLIVKFNTVPSSIQNCRDFIDAFEEIARKAKNKVEIEEGLIEHRKIQLRDWRRKLEDASQDIGLLYGSLPDPLWNAVLSIVSPGSSVRPADESGWQSPVSLQGFVEVLQLLQKSFDSNAPPEIEPPRLALSAIGLPLSPDASFISPSPDSKSLPPPSPPPVESSYVSPPDPSSLSPFDSNSLPPTPPDAIDFPPESSKEKAPGPSRTLRPRKHIHTQNQGAVAKGRVNKRVGSKGGTVTTYTHRCPNGKGLRRSTRAKK